MSEEPAQSHAGPNNAKTAFPLEGRTHTFPGMELRDWFAGQALTATIEMMQDTRPDVGETWDQMIARNCFETADAMLAAREK